MALFEQRRRLPQHVDGIQFAVFQQADGFAIQAGQTGRAGEVPFRARHGGVV